MQNKFTQKAQRSLERAAEEAGLMGHAYIGTEHLLLGLALEKDSIAARVLFARGLGATVIRASILALLGEGERCVPQSDSLTPKAKKIIENSADIAKKRGCTYIGTEHILYALLGEPSSTGASIIEGAGVPLSLLAEDLSAHQSSFINSKKEPTEKTPETQEKKLKSSASLSQYSVDLTELAALGKLDPTIGREKETERVIQILSRRTKNNPCLIGEPGVGKTAVVEGLAKRIADKKVPLGLEGKRILCLDIPSMIAGAKYRGEFEDRLKSVMKDVQARKDVILFIDEMHVIVGAGAAEGAVDAANILKPALARGGIRLIGATTLGEYKKHVESDSALERRFQAVSIDEPSVEQTVKILEGLRQRYEAHHKISISDGAIRAAATLSERYISDRFLPDKAIDLIDEAAAKLCIERDARREDIAILQKELSDVRSQRNEYVLLQDYDKAAELREKELSLDKRIGDTQPTLSEEHVASLLEEQTGIPAHRLLDGESGSLLDMEACLSKRIVGQEHAISALSSAIRRGRIGLKNPNRPTGSFLFLGSSGVGKSALATAVAEELLGSKSALLRFDMSEFMEKHSVSRLIGSPPGYVGYGEGGQLTEKVRRRPYCVVLFDEIEKAHSDVFNLLLQILEDGRLTDSQGRTVSFCNSIIIMTSNVGTSGISRKTGFGDAHDAAKVQKERITEAAKQTFKPELLSRIDEMIVFNDLSLSSLQKIASTMLDEVVERAHALGFEISFDSSVSEMIAQSGMKDGCGARNVRRIIAKEVEDKISLDILNGKLQKCLPLTFSAESEHLVMI
ncbi:MAG: ATP-dependent Clp protease ATP-binding subunit [Ruminococcaceae bacterium]|nr:ATP-dependent Clp protease ATP-binding subunit [Oscillospiraceae bacterium]